MYENVETGLEAAAARAASKPTVDGADAAQYRFDDERVDTGIAELAAAAPTNDAPDTTSEWINPGKGVSPQAPPAFIQPNFDRMPPELKPLKNWVLWAAVWNGSNWKKRPMQISGYWASATNAKHWSSFNDVQQAYERAVQRGYMELRERGKPVQQVPVGGVGFVFDGSPDENGLVLAGVDFDKVISEGRIAPIAKKRIKRLGSYTELSVSGGGLHVILKARPLKSGIAHDGVEMYTSGRFFTMTGAAL